MMTNKKVGIYIHIPFCIRKCLYCDFCSFPDTDASVRDAYIDALCRELYFYRPSLTDYTVDTVYFGGGTPSLLTAMQTARIISTIKEIVPISENAEITTEVNPATCDYEKLLAWKAMGINRLSVGVQSFSDKELVALGRLHTADEAEAFVRLARTAGFENISIDLMYAIPHQNASTFTDTLRRAISLSPQHISAYGLKVEPGTPFATMGTKLLIPDGDGEADLYEQCIATLAEAGYEHYEISNYAKRGYVCQHNLRYWQMQEYIGIGVAAYSYFDGRRYGHDRDLASYLSCPTFSHLNTPRLTEKETEYEYIMLALRLSNGISEENFRRRFGYGFREKYGERLALYVSHDLVRYTGDRTTLTDKGMYVSLGILAEILDDIDPDVAKNS